MFISKKIIIRISIETNEKDAMTEAAKKRWIKPQLRILMIEDCRFLSAYLKKGSVKKKKLRIEKGRHFFYGWRKKK